MKNIKWQGFVFLLIIFMFAIGLSFIAFNEKSTENADKEQTMAIALVNEDDGASLEGEDEAIIFGDEFANKVLKDDKHDWYVVSRGVAESGFDRHLYDMMVVIPNNFSERSLSIHLDKPEPVSLHYKINATGHDNVRAEAEKTAEQVLNDFNRRLIDVYFASIIGNLQDAQDNIGDIIEKEKEYTNLYNNEVNFPLSNFTDQFSTVQDYTTQSKDSFGALETVLDGFQTNLSEEADLNKGYSDEITSVIQMKEEENKISAAFGEYFDTFNNQMRDDDVLTRLELLEQTNQYIHSKFEKEPERSSLVTQSDEMEAHLNQMKLDVNEFNDELKAKIYRELEENVEKGLDTAFDQAYEDDVTLTELFGDLDSNIHNEIKQHIELLPSLNKGEIANSGLSNQTVTDLENVIDVTNKFHYDHTLSGEAEDSAQGKLLSDRMKEIKSDLVTEGVLVEDEIDYLPKYEDGEQYFTLKLPKGFSLKDQQVQINEKSYEYDEDNGIKLESPSEGKFSIKTTFTLDHEDADIDVFSPIKWEWIVRQEGMQEVEEESAEPDENDGQEEDSSEETEEDKEENNDAEASDEDTSTEDSDEEDDEQSDESEEDGEKDDDTDSESEGDGDSPEEDEDDQPIVSETITETNNYLHQKVLSPVVTDATNDLISTTSEMIQDYYKLHSIYELYYGFEMSQESPKLKNPTEDSLYYLLHEKNIKDVLKDNVAENIKEEVTKDVRQSMGIIEEQVDQYVNYLDQVNEASSHMVEDIAESREHANVLNDELANMLSELDAWRGVSEELITDKNVVLDNNMDMQTAIMDLDSGYQPLIQSSEQLAEQARTNFDTADNVYQTFDAIDEQAETIQNSGITLVSEANDLAEKLTEKSLTDENFADNFNEVLANSRVGDRQNENLYQFLADPVQTKNDGIVTKGESYTSYFLVIILAILTLFTSYVLSTLHQRKMQSNAFTENNSIMQMNMPIASLTAGIGLIEGLIVGLLSFYLLNFNQSELYIWLGLVIIVTMLMLFISTYLLRQLKMIGMFLLLTVFALYLLLTKSLGFTFEHKALVKTLQQISPLQYVETLLSDVMTGDAFITAFMIIALILFTVLGFLINLFVFQIGTKEEELDDGNTAEAK